MSLLKTIKQQLGLSGTASENHFWDGSVPNQLSLKRGTPDAPGAELIKALNGVLSFPNQGQSLTDSGYVKLPGGLIVQWGTANTGIANTPVNTAFAVPFPTSVLHIVANVKSDIGTNAVLNMVTNSGLTHVSLAATAGPVACSFIAIGY